MGDDDVVRFFINFFEAPSWSRASRFRIRAPDGCPRSSSRMGHREQRSRWAIRTYVGADRREHIVHTAARRACVSKPSSRRWMNSSAMSVCGAAALNLPSSLASGLPKPMLFRAAEAGKDRHFLRVPSASAGCALPADRAVQCDRHQQDAGPGRGRRTGRQQLEDGALASPDGPDKWQPFRPTGYRMESSPSADWPGATDRRSRTFRNTTSPPTRARAAVADRRGAAIPGSSSSSSVNPFGRARGLAQLAPDFRQRASARLQRPRRAGTVPACRPDNLAGQHVVRADPQPRRPRRRRR